MCKSVVLVMQHAKRMRRIILSSMACLALSYFSTLSLKRHDFRKKIIEHKICASIFCTNFSETFLIVRKIQRVSIINLHISSCKYHLITSDVTEN
jgi:hypothetical protein